MAKSDKSVVGDPIRFRGMVYAPMCENGVVFLFGMVAEDLNMYVEEVKPGFPDCIARRFTGKGWEQVRVEFEFKSGVSITSEEIFIFFFLAGSEGTSISNSFFSKASTKLFFGVGLETSLGISEKPSFGISKLFGLFFGSDTIGSILGTGVNSGSSL